MIKSHHGKKEVPSNAESAYLLCSLAHASGGIAFAGDLVYSKYRKEISELIDLGLASKDETNAGGWSGYVIDWQVGWITSPHRERLAGQEARKQRKYTGSMPALKPFVPQPTNLSRGAASTRVSELEQEVQGLREQLTATQAENQDEDAEAQQQQ